MVGSRVAVGVVGWVRLLGAVGGVVGVLVCGSCGWLVGSAWATTGHALVGQFGGQGSGLGQFDQSVGPDGLGVLGTTGDVFTLDGGRRVQRFDAGGVVQDSFSIQAGYGPTALAVGPGGVVYVLAWGGDAGAPPTLLRYTGSGTPMGEIDGVLAGLSLNVPGYNSGCGAVAVDPVDGTVYVSATDANNAQVIASFDGVTGAFKSSLSGVGSPTGSFSCPGGLAVDSSQRLYVVDSGEVDQYASDGTFLATVFSKVEDAAIRGPPVAVSTDPATGEVYVAAAGPGGVGMQVTQLAAGGGSVLNVFDASAVGGVRAMAVGGSGMVYLSDSASPFVMRYGSFVGPTVTTDPATDVGARSATLNGSIIPEGASSYHFEYGPDQSYGSRTPEVDVGAGGSAVAAMAEIDGLDPSLLYHYRIVGSNAAGSITGADQTLTTAAAAATLDHVAPFVSSITPRSARLYMSINPNRNFGVGWHVEYGTTTTYGQTAVLEAPADGSFAGFCFVCGGVDVPVVASATGLEPGTLYHFRLVADPDGVGGVQLGVDQTFITAPAAAAGAVDVTTKRALLRGTINPHNVGTSYHFNYGPTTAYGSSTPEVGGVGGDGERLVTQAITGLEPSTTYHVQIVAQSGDVIRSGGDGVFTTPPAPSATAGFPTGVSTSTATLTGTASTFGAAGSYRFEVTALDGSYQVVTEDRALAAAAGPQPVSVAVAGLPAGKTFGVQLLVSANEATEYSDLITFSTAPNPQLPLESDPTTVFGCRAPHIDAYNKRPQPGEVITITGQDLGQSGTVTIGEETFTPTDWNQTAFKVRVPDEAQGTLALTAGCGRVSNTIALAIFHVPDNRFSVPSRSVSATTARLVVRVPGPGKIETTGTRITASKTTVKKAGGEITITTKLNRAGVKALNKAKSHKLTVKIRVRYTPAGGKPATKSLTVTFRKAGR